MAMGCQVVVAQAMLAAAPGSWAVVGQGCCCCCWRVGGSWRWVAWQRRASDVAGGRVSDDIGAGNKYAAAVRGIQYAGAINSDK